MARIARAQRAGFLALLSGLVLLLVLLLPGTAVAYGPGPPPTSTTTTTIAPTTTTTSTTVAPTTTTLGAGVGPLAFTGSDVLETVALALVLIGLGVTLRLASGRRRNN